MKLHRLLAYKTYRRLDKLKSDYELLKIEHGSPGALGALGTIFERFHPHLNIETVAQFTNSAGENQDCYDLRKLFDSYGSDKSTTHNNHYLYESILRGRRTEALQILEIGLGTCNMDVPSNMGANGKPGASLRAFRDWAPNSTIVGVDVDERVLFSEDRISTYHVDQLKIATLKKLASRFQPHSFDLLIDDGLHTPEANANFLNMAIDLVKAGGYIVIEDVAERDHSFWSFMSWALEGKFDLHFIKTKYACVIIIKSLLSRISQAV